MDKQEQIEQLKELKPLIMADGGYPRAIRENIAKALDMAIEGLEKQIPKKICTNKSHRYYCDNCGTSCHFLVSYCDHCGQALDWSE